MKSIATIDAIVLINKTFDERGHSVYDIYLQSAFPLDEIPGLLEFLNKDVTMRVLRNELPIGREFPIHINLN